MTPAQRLQVEQSEKRQKINELLAADELTDEQRGELQTLTGRMQQIEVELRAAIVAEADEEKRGLETAPDAEQRERLELRSKASLTAYLQAAMAGRQVRGAEAELQSAAEAGDGIPLELWDTQDTIETRADTVTGTPSTTGLNLAPIQPAVFAASIAPRLGIAMPRVASGSYASATITTSLTANAQNKGGEQMATAASFTPTTVTPKRISARLAVAIEDVASVGTSNFESILRENLSLVLSDSLDNAAINGDGQAPNLKGIFTSLTDPTDPTAVADFDAFAATHAGAVDGLWANTIKDVGIVVGPATYSLSARTFQAATNYKGELSAAAYAMTNTGGWWTNKRMPAAASNIQQAILYRKGRSGLRTAVCPHWNMISVDDIYSGSAKGERYFTMHVLLGDVILTQPDAYAQVAFKLA